MSKLKSRKTKPATYNLDMNLIGDYWGWFGKRSYHHTGPVSTFYAMREALAIVGEEGLEVMWERHLKVHQQLWAGLEALGLEPYVKDPQDRWAGGGGAMLRFGGRVCRREACALVPCMMVKVVTPEGR